MSGETEKQVSDWTVDTAKALLEAEICAIRKTIKESDRRYEQRFDAQEKATNTALTSAKEAVTKAETATEKRFESVNEFRSALSDQTATLIGREEYAASHKSIIEKIDNLSSRLDRSEGQSKGSDKTIAYVVTAISVIFGLVGIGIAVFK